MDITKNYLQKTAKDPHLHSPNHVLADELANKLGDPRHFGFYLKMATEVDHNILRKLAGEVTEGNSSNPGALFAFLLKKHKREKVVSQGYSIWLLPEPESAKMLAECINNLAAELKTSAFEPHVTLVSGIEDADEKALSQLASVELFTVNVKAPRSGDGFFQSLFLPLIKNKEMLAARRIAKKAFGMSSSIKYEPHLTLVYGNLPEEDKLAAAKKFYTAPIAQITFTSLSLVKTTGTSDEFKTIKVIPLKKHDPKNR
jgi:2'-5' RNA ligase